MQSVGTSPLQGSLRGPVGVFQWYLDSIHQISPHPTPRLIVCYSAMLRSPVCCVFCTLDFSFASFVCLRCFTTWFDHFLFIKFNFWLHVNRVVLSGSALPFHESWRRLPTYQIWDWYLFISLSARKLNLHTSKNMKPFPQWNETPFTAC